MYKFLHGLLEALSKLLPGLAHFFTPLFLLTAGLCTAMGAKMMKTTGEGGLHMGRGKRQSELSAWGLGFCSHIQGWFSRHIPIGQPLLPCRSSGLDIHTSQKYLRAAGELFLVLQPFLFSAQVLLC